MKTALFPSAAVGCGFQFQTLEKPAIHIEDGRFTYVGPRSTAPRFDADETIEGEHLVAMPGMVNTHTHAGMTLLRGYADDLPLEVWLQTKIWPFEANLHSDDVYWGTLLACAEMIRGGTTTFCDMYFHENRGVEAALKAGMRMCPGAVLLGFLPGANEKIARAREFVRDWRGHDLITPFLAPHSLYTCDESQWQQIIEVAREENAIITTHVSETKFEVADVTAKWGQSPVQTLHKLGALDGHLLAAHCVHTDSTDRDIMASTPFYVAHNPQSNLKLASGIAPIEDYLSRGIGVGLGPDGTASNNNLDMWEEMRLAATLHKATTGDATIVTAQQALKMATIDGARCLGLDSEIGTLEAGKRADLLLIDFDKPHLYPRHNITSHLVYAANSADVHSTLVGGKFLLRDGKFQTLDVREVGNECSTRGQALSAKAAAASVAN
ncbi:amidohydrolase [bacterium]|nr:MAG: amidohydrolase [bacterium]